MSVFKKMSVALVVALSFLSVGTKSLLGLADKAAAQSAGERGSEPPSESGHGATCEA